ncbi:MAG: hypothetical protein QF847_08425, partial [Candidatus Marinimicrobia bacterium]|nr:hypothetical protein [Candidatus Neomarinimicrobiota bacterium]
MRNIFITIFLLSGIFAQDYESKYVLVKLDRDVNKGEFRTVLDPTKYAIEKTVVRRLGIYKVRILN